MVSCSILIESSLLEFRRKLFSMNWFYFTVCLGKTKIKLREKGKLIVFYLFEKEKSNSNKTESTRIDFLSRSTFEETDLSFSLVCIFFSEVNLNIEVPDAHSSIRFFPGLFLKEFFLFAVLLFVIFYLLFKGFPFSFSTSPLFHSDFFSKDRERERERGVLCVQYDLFGKHDEVTRKRMRTRWRRRFEIVWNSFLTDRKSVSVKNAKTRTKERPIRIFLSFFLSRSIIAI